VNRFVQFRLVTKPRLCLKMVRDASAIFSISIRQVRTVMRGAAVLWVQGRAARLRFGLEIS
jgi:hypothetical protein